MYGFDCDPKAGRVLTPPGNFGFKDVAMHFSVGWIQSDGSENIIVSAVANQVRKTVAGAIHLFQIRVDPNRADSIIHDPYIAPQGSTVVVKLAGII